MTITVQTKKETKCDGHVLVPKEDGKHSSTLFKEAVVVDDQNEKQKIYGRIPTKDCPEMVDPTRQKPSNCSVFEDKADQEKVAKMSKPQTAEEDPTDRKSVESNELNQIETLGSGSTWPKDDKVNHKLKGEFNMKSAIE